ncbi:MAG: AGE family epimerase/isomerase, partial [Clostridia bacterium]
VWFQGRGLWLYAKLCNTYGIRDEWLDAARLGYRFLNEHCFDDDGRMFFQLTTDGKPLRKRRYMFSETFAVIAFAEYAKATGDKGALEKARKVYDLVVSIYRDPGNDPYRIPPKFNPAVRPMKAMAVPMILLNTNHVLRDADGERGGFYDQMARVYINDILNNFFKPDCKALLETVGVHGERLDTPMGRVVNPGHAIEAAWFLMHEALHFKDDIIMKKALDILLWSLDLGWDKEYGGIFYYTDIRKFQPEQLEWDMKLWWPHTEALYALLLAYGNTRDERFAKWYGKIHEYTFDRFPDRRYGEWFGYLHRDGTVSHTLKGSVFKGPFHIPRTLLLCAELLKARQPDFMD